LHEACRRSGWQDDCYSRTGRRVMNCEHTGCHCTDATVERDGKQFCSERCADAAQSKPRGAACDCGHPDCAAV
jgi:hypothetical protein